MKLEEVRKGETYWLRFPTGHNSSELFGEFRIIDTDAGFGNDGGRVVRGELVSPGHRHHGEITSVYPRRLQKLDEVKTIIRIIIVLEELVPLMRKHFLFSDGMADPDKLIRDMKIDIYGKNTP